MGAIDVLQRARRPVLAGAAASLSGHATSRYRSSTPKENAERLRLLLEAVLESLRQGHHDAIERYVGAAAGQRFAEGFGLGDVLAAFNALEVAIWAQLLEDIPLVDFPRAAGSVGGALAAGKRALVDCYLATLSQRKWYPRPRVMGKGVCSGRREVEH